VGESSYAALTVAPAGEAVTRFHLVVDVEDRQGVLAAVAGMFAQQGVSIETLRQRIRAEQDAELVIVTHPASKSRLDATVEVLRTAPVVRSVVSVMRVEEL
jgi:homoserine dehydrogenase